MRIRGAGRTDSGAHARGQVADCAGRDAAATTPLLARALRQHAAARTSGRAACSRRSASFNAQHDARSKTYRYLVDTSAAGDPLLPRFASAPSGALDAAAVDAALAALFRDAGLVGIHGSRVPRSTIACARSPRRAASSSGRDCSRFVFTADGFLTHMVRNLVGTLLEVGRRTIGPERVAEILETRDRRRAGPTAPANGLCLERVVYDEAMGGASGDSASLW